MTGRIAPEEQGNGANIIFLKEGKVYGKRTFARKGN
jgi:hypothetical protein